MSDTCQPFGVLEAEQSLCQRFESVVGRFPDHVAFSSASDRLTYDELNQKANRIAHRLCDLFPEGNNNVGLLLDQGADLVSALFGTLKSGCCYIPLDPTVPLERLKKIITGGRCSALIGNADTDTLISAISGENLPLILLHQMPDSLSTSNPERSISPLNQAYIIFTSGSTGEPKGVIQNHLSVLHSTSLFSNYFSITSNDRLSQLYTPGVFGSQRDTFNALLNGAELCHYPLRTNGLLGLPDWIDESGITIYCSVANVFRRMTVNLPAQRKFSGVRLVKCGGEATLWEDVDHFYQHFTRDCQLFCGFSMTETNLVTQNFVTPGQVRTSERVPLGIPVPGKEVLIQDDDGNEVAAETIGNLVIRSRYISPGYVGREDLTSQMFSDDIDDPSQRIFTTGDLGVKHVDGSIEFIGRKDFQVKIRGFRIDLLEIEVEILKIPWVQESAVVTQKFTGGDSKIIAYVVCKYETRGVVSEIRDQLKSTLPVHMLPSHYMLLPELPQTHNGKVDRAGLPRVRKIERENANSYVKPEGDLQKALIACWESYLGVGGVGIDDDFFESGGDSLCAAQLLLDVNERFGVRIEASDIL